MSTTRADLPYLAITMGDINGIGPEIIAKAIAKPETRSLARLIVIGSADALNDARRFTADCPPARRVNEFGDHATDESIPVFDAGVSAPQAQPGTIDGEAGRCAAEWFRAGVLAAIEESIDGVVTCPLNKEGMQKGGVRYPGHTEILADLTNTSEYRMSLFAEKMRIVFVTAHVPLRKAIDLITTERIVETAKVAHTALERMGLPRRRIAVAGLNPHAGEAGILGDEEQTIIGPAVQQCRDLGIDCVGPLPPDAVFRQMVEGAFDLVVSLYHDQGHIPLKLVEMDDGVNVTLGTPVVRTSVDHGTAYDIAGRGVAREASLVAAIRLAAQLSRPQPVENS